MQTQPASLKIKAKKENLSLITTEKDFFRLSKLERKNIKFLKITGAKCQILIK